MNYLEISILILFIGFLVLFYVSNQVYNKCVHDKELQEGFGPISPELAAVANSEVKEANADLIARMGEETKALAEQAAMEARFAGSQADMKKYQDALASRRSEDEQNRSLINAWDKYRNKTFKGYNHSLDGIKEEVAKLDSSKQSVQALWEKYNRPYDPNTIDDGTSIPTKLHQIKTSIQSITPFVEEQRKRIRREEDKFDPVTGLLLPGEKLVNPGVVAQMNYVDGILGQVNAQRAAEMAAAKANFQGANVQEGFKKMTMKYKIKGRKKKRNGFKNYY
jgi:hypothetical protein